MNEIVLVEYDKACRQLERAVYVNEVMRIKDQADIMRACAKVMKNRQLEANAWQLRVQAERRLGQMLEEGKGDRAPEGRPKTRSDGTRLPTLTEMGIGEPLANRARRLNNLSKEEFGKFLIDGANQNQRHAEIEVNKKKSKAKVKPSRDLECPHCGKPVTLVRGKLCI